MMETRSQAAGDDRTPLAIAAGLIAALLAGGAWAAIVLITNYEIGWAAWGIGALVGIAMARTTRNRSRGLAVAAATLALVGLVAGKAFVLTGSTGAVADQLMENPQYLQGAVAWQMYEAGELHPSTLDAIAATEAAGDTLSDAVWAEMLEQAGARLATLGEEERRALAELTAAGFVQRIGLIDGLVTQLTPFDLLWAFLALGTAFRFMDGRPEEEEREVVEAEPEVARV